MKRPYLLMVDSDTEDEPDPRRFSSLAAAMAAFDQLDPQWKKFAWVMEIRPNGNIVYVKDGVRS